MNALLQHRGANLMGAGRSIAVQNFNEQACILGLGAFYTGLTGFGLSAFAAIAVFGLVVAGDHVDHPALAPVELRAPSGRDRAPALDRPARQALSRMAARLLPGLALVFNAFVWGTSWWPFRHLQGARPASALGHGDRVHARRRCVIAGGAAAGDPPGADDAGAVAAGRRGRRDQRRPSTGP